MSEPIKVGDLVVTVRWPCCGYGLGRIFQVNNIRGGLSFACDNCGHKDDAELTVAWDGNPRGFAAQFAWLKRIPPLSELESVDEKETLHA